MDTNPSRKPLALEPLEEAPRGDSARPIQEQPAAVDAPQRDLRIAAADEFLAQAASEYQEGRIDQPLWDRTAAQFDGDEALLVAAYLRVRARALKMKRRDERADSQRVPGNPNVESQTRQEPLAPEVGGAGHPNRKAQLKYAGAAVAFAAAVAVVWLAVSPRDGGDVVPQPKALAAATSQKAAASPTPLGSGQPVAKDASGAADQSGAEKTLETRVQELKKAENWNVLVLYAAEWTRKEPNNATAWNELSLGYGKLRQLGDAREAATKAVQLPPEDSRHWRNLGHVNLILERLPEARIAFDKALQMSAEDADALCGAAAVAKGEGRAKDADALAARLKSIDGNCGDASDPVISAVVPVVSPARKAVPPRSR